MTSLVQSGVEEGAEVSQPPCKLPERGYWFVPTVFTNVAQSYRIAQEEIFGPVLSVLTFRTPDEAIEKANNTPYGLSAGVWTEKGSRILAMAQKLRAGVVWANTYNRGQVLYRVAEMMEARRAELAGLSSGADEVERAIDRVVWYAGWADKLAQVVGSANPVAGPYFNFTVPEPAGVVGILAPEPPLLGLVSRLAPVLVGGNTAVVVASEAHPLVAIELAECLATADVPPGVVNVITGLRRELAPQLASHMDVVALDVTGADGDLAELERLGAENVKRIVRGKADGQSPYEIAAFLELKTVWHPIGM